MPAPAAVPIVLNAVSRRFHHVGSIAVVSFRSVIILQLGFGVRGSSGGQSSSGGSQSLPGSSYRSLSEGVFQANAYPQVAV